MTAKQLVEAEVPADEPSPADALKRIAAEPAPSDEPEALNKRCKAVLAFIPTLRWWPARGQLLSGGSFYGAMRQLVGLLEQARDPAFPPSFFEAFIETDVEILLARFGATFVCLGDTDAIGVFKAEGRLSAHQRAAVEAYGFRCPAKLRLHTSLVNKPEPKASKAFNLRRG